jgi:hypothetical protein
MVVISVSVFQMEWFLYACHEEHAAGDHFHEFRFPTLGVPGCLLSHDYLICGKFVSFV